MWHASHRTTPRQTIGVIAKEGIHEYHNKQMYLGPFRDRRPGWLSDDSPPESGRDDYGAASATFGK
jgi:hypothetical protein